MLWYTLTHPSTCLLHTCSLDNCAGCIYKDYLPLFSSPSLYFQIWTTHWWAGEEHRFTNTPSEENHHHLQFKFKDRLSAAGSHIKPNVTSELHLIHTDGRSNKRAIITVTSSTCRGKPIHLPLCMMNRWARESIVQSSMHVMQIWSTRLQDVETELSHSIKANRDHTLT